MRTKTAILSILSVAATAGCGEAPSEDLSCPAETCIQTSAGLCRLVEPVSPDLENTLSTGHPHSVMAGVARRNPGFGGFRLETSLLVILMVDPLQTVAEDIRGELAGIFSTASRRIEAARVITETTPYDYLELLSYYYSAPVLGLEGVFSSSINESVGRIEYGVIDDASRICLRENLRRMNIPDDAVDIEIGSPPSFALD